VWHHGSMGGRSIPLMRVFGIRIGVSPLWFLVLFILIFGLSGYYQDLYPNDDGKAFALAVTASLLFPASILLHELGHALAARHYGIEVSGIELWLLGGLARMKAPRSPAAEFVVAAAGPLVSLLLVLIGLALGLTVFDWNDFRAGAELDLRQNMGEAEAVLGYVTGINLFVFAFNLIPGLPLDGGRMALAIAWWRTGDRVRATRLAATLGRFVAYGLSAFAAFLLITTGDAFYAVWLLFIAFFIAQSAKAEEVWSQRVSSQLDGLRVSDVMDPEPVAVGNGVKLDRALDEFFWRYRAPWFPVTDNLGHLVGLVTLESVEKVPEALRPGSTVDEVMARDPQSLKIGLDEPLEALLAAEGLHRLGALFAVDRDDVLRGVVTLDQVRRALRAPATVDTTA
jgi:Zn-dependent protease/CBS domain-containing protein